MKYSVAFGSISSKRPASFSLALLSRSMVHRCTKISIRQGSVSIIFDPRDMLLSLHIDFSFVRAAVACAIITRTSGCEPSSKTIAPRYLKLVTVASFCPVTLITLWVLLALFVISLVFSARTSSYILYFEGVISRLSTRASSFCSSSAREINVIGKTRIGNGFAAYANLSIMFF